MQSKATTVDDYIAELPVDRQKAISQLRTVINKNLPSGYEEGMGYGMIGYAVPHSMYPKGYHCNPLLPLPFMSLGSQKNYIVFHHMGLYANPALLEWFITEYENAGVGKLEMGKGCVRFKRADNIPFELIGKLTTKIKPAEWIDIYEQKFKKA